MTSLQVLIVEDDFSFALELSMLVEEIGCKVLRTVDNSDEAQRAIRRLQPDVVLMDIDIKGRQNGLEVAAAVQNPHTAFIFITASSTDRAYEKAKKLQTAAFLVKPVDPLTLRSTIELSMERVAKAQKNTGEGPPGKHFLIKKNNVLHRVAAADVFFAESAQNYVILQTAEQKFVMRSSLTSLEKELAEHGFARSHRSYLINLAQVSQLNLSENRVVLQDYTVPLSRRHREKLLQRLQDEE